MPVEQAPGECDDQQRDHVEAEEVVEAEVRVDQAEIGRGLAGIPPTCGMFS